MQAERTPVAGAVAALAAELVEAVDLAEADRRLGASWDLVQQLAEGLDELMVARWHNQVEGELDVETAWRLTLFARNVRRDAEALAEWAAAIEGDAEELANPDGIALPARLAALAERTAR